MSGAYHAIYAAYGSDSDRLTVTNNLFTANLYSGLFVDQLNEFLTIDHNTFELGATYYGTLLYAADATITSNVYTGGGFYGSGEVRGPRSLIANNRFETLRNGLSTNNYSSAPADQIIVRDNAYSDMREWAIAQG